MMFQVDPPVDRTRWKRSGLGIGVALTGLLVLTLIASAVGEVQRTTSLVSAPTGVPDPDLNDPAFKGASRDGETVFFETSEVLAADDHGSSSGGGHQVDVYQRSNGTTALVSTGPGGGFGAVGAFFAGASADGSRVFFRTGRPMTLEADEDSGWPDIYQRAGGATTLISKATGVSDPKSGPVDFAGTSDSGARVLFTTGQKLTSDDTDTGKIDLYQRANGVTTLVSKPSGVADTDSGHAEFAGSSSDGSKVFFTTTQPMTADDSGGYYDVFQRANGVTTLISTSTGVADPAIGNATFEDASADGSVVFFSSDQKLTASDTDSGRPDVYQRAGGVTSLVSAPTGVADPNTAAAHFAGASADGSRVFFQTTERLTPGDTDAGLQDIYQRRNGTTTLISASTGIADANSAPNDFKGVSLDGSRVFFETAGKLTSDDLDTSRVDVYQRSGGVTRLMSKPSEISDPNSYDSYFSGSSADGSRVFFTSRQKLTLDDSDSDRVDIYQRFGETTALVSKPSGVTDPDAGNSSFAGVSADGMRVFFETRERLTNADNDSDRLDIYVSAEPRPRKPRARCGGRLATIVGDARANVLAGSRRADVIAGLGGNDRIAGRGGNDVICGGGGRDRLVGGGGRDRLLGQAGPDVLLGGPGPDILKGGPGRDVLRGGPGRDRERQ